jgi:hypothetical protein
MPAGGVISHLTATCSGNVHEEAPADQLSLSFVRSMTSARDVVVFLGSVAKTPDTIKQKSSDHLAGDGSQPRKVDLTHFSGIFRLRGGLDIGRFVEGCCSLQVRFQARQCSFDCC